jgi:hypothetical protein
MDTEKVNDCINTLLFNEGELKSQDAKDIIDVLHEAVKNGDNRKDLKVLNDTLCHLRYSLKTEKEKSADLQKQVYEKQQLPHIMSEKEKLICREYFFNDIDNIGMYSYDNVAISITNHNKEMDKIKYEISQDMLRESGTLRDYDVKTARLRNRLRDCALRLRMLELRKKELEILGDN